MFALSERREVRFARGLTASFKYVLFRFFNVLFWVLGFCFGFRVQDFAGCSDALRVEGLRFSNPLEEF